MPRFVNDGVSLHYEVHGEGTPVVMLHGGAVSFALNFGFGWVDRLNARGLQVVGTDFRGHGQSDKPLDTAMYGTEVATSDVIALMDHLGIERACLVGYSIGSTIALHLLHTHAGRFTVGALVATGDGLIGLSPLNFPAIMPVLSEIVQRPEFPGDLPPHQAAYWTFADQAPGCREALAFAGKAEFPVCEPREVATIEVPVLVVSADNDLVLGTGARLAEALPNGTFLEIAGADHFSLALDEDVQTAVADFLANANAAGTL